MKIKKTALIISFLLFTSLVSAHSWWTDNNWCHAWSEPYHCHNEWNSSEAKCYEICTETWFENYQEQQVITYKEYSSEEIQKYCDFRIVPMAWGSPCKYQASAGTTVTKEWTPITKQREICINYETVCNLKTNEKNIEEIPNESTHKKLKKSSNNRYAGQAIIPEKKPETYADKIGRFQQAKADKVITILQTMADDQVIIKLVMDISKKLDEDSEKYNLAMYMISALNNEPS